MTVALGEMDRIRLSMSVTAHPRTVQALDAVIRKAELIQNEADQGGALTNVREQGLALVETQLFKAVKKNLRLKPR